MEELKSNEYLDKYLKLEKDDVRHPINRTNNLGNQTTLVKIINMIIVDKPKKELLIQ